MVGFSVCCVLHFGVHIFALKAHNSKSIWRNITDKYNGEKLCIYDQKSQEAQLVFQVSGFGLLDAEKVSVGLFALASEEVFVAAVDFDEPSKV